MEPYHTVLLLVSDLLPPNVISVTIRRVNRACLQRYADSTVVDCSAWLPLWAVQEGVREAARRSDRRDKQDNIRKFWHSIVKSGDVDNLQLLAARRGSAWDRGIYEAAAAAGHVRIMSWALHNKCPRRHTVLERGLPHDKVLNYFRAACTREAAKNGHINVLEWLDRVGGFSAEDVCANAARTGQLRVLRWARSRNPPCWWDALTTSSAAYSGNLALLRWLLGQGCPWDARVCSSAAAGGHRHIIQWARANGCPWDELVCKQAAGRGDRALLEWAVLNGCPWDRQTCDAAGEGGHLALLLWASANGCPCVLDERFAAGVAMTGQLHVLQWARSQEPPCPWDACVTYFAATKQHSELLQWAVDNGCPHSTITYAEVRRHKLPVKLPGFRRYCITSNSRQCFDVVVVTGTVVLLLAGVVWLARRPRAPQPEVGSWVEG